MGVARMTNESIWEKVDSVEKRFENRLDKSNVKFNTLNPVWDTEKEDALNVFEMIDELNYLNDCCNNLIDDNTEYVAEINQMHKENEQLKKDATTLIYANQDYRQQNQNLQKQLDYIQNSITNAIKHQKTELGQKALREIIEDYNEWLLGHKELQE